MEIDIKKRQYALSLENYAGKLNGYNREQAEEKGLTKDDFIRDLSGTIYKALGEYGIKSANSRGLLEIPLEPYDNLNEEELKKLVEDMGKICTKV